MEDMQKLCKIHVKYYKLLFNELTIIRDRRAGACPAASLQRLHRRKLNVPSYLCFTVIPRCFATRDPFPCRPRGRTMLCIAKKRIAAPVSNWRAMPEGSRWRDVSDSVLWGSGGFGGVVTPPYIEPIIPG